METWNEKQIKLCEELSKLLPKREPKVGEWWYFRSASNVCGFILGTLSFEGKVFDYEVYAEPEPGFGALTAIHPLYTVEELLEMLRDKANLLSYKEANRIFDEIGIAMGDENIKTALLKLAVEVMGK